MSKESACKSKGLCRYETTKRKRANKFVIILTLITLKSPNVLVFGANDDIVGQLINYPSGSVESWRSENFAGLDDPFDINRAIQKLLTLKETSIAPKKYRDTSGEGNKGWNSFVSPLAIFENSATKKEKPLIAKSNGYRLQKQFKPDGKGKTLRKYSALAVEEKRQNDICSKLGVGKPIRSKKVDEDNGKDFRDLGHVDVIYEILEAITRGVEFMRREYRVVNLDAIIGTRILEGQLTVLLKQLKTAGFNDQQDQSDTKDDGKKIEMNYSKDEDKLDLNLISIAQLEHLLTTSINISDAAVEMNKLNQPIYFQRIGTLLKKGLWQLDYRTHDVDPELLEEFQMEEDGNWKEVMRESESDDCLTELFGTSGKSKSSKCRISSSCWNMMTSQGYHGYSLTHQVFYQQIAQMVGCFNMSTTANILLSDDISAKFCTKILHEAQTIAMCDFPEHGQDLFMEQAGLCGMLGYRQFFRKSWLQKILGWQNRNLGCWMKKYEYGKRMSEYGESDIKQRELGEKSARVRREEKVLSDGCGSHKTAVALSALIGYLRYSLEQLLTNWTSTESETI